MTLIVWIEGILLLSSEDSPSGPRTPHAASCSWCGLSLRWAVCRWPWGQWGVCEPRWWRYSSTSRWLLTAGLQMAAGNVHRGPGGPRGASPRSGWQSRRSAVKVQTHIKAENTWSRFNQPWSREDNCSILGGTQSLQSNMVLLEGVITAAERSTVSTI